MKDVIEESKRQPVLVDFWAEWCGPCKQLTPVLEKAVNAAKGKVKLVKMDIDKHPAIPGQMGIQSIPAVIAFVNGQPADGFLGALPESQVNDFIARITKDKLGGEAQDLLKLADAGARRRQRRRGGRALRRGAEGRAGQRAGARGPRARLRVDRRDSSRRSRRSRSCRRQSATIRRSRRRAPRSKSPSRRSRSARSASSSRRSPPIPLDHQARFDLAVALNAAGKRKEAADQLIEIVKRDRKWNDDGARKQLVQFFEAWGPTDEATVEGRRKLSSILFA